MGAADDDLQNYRFAGRVAMRHFDVEIGRGGEHLPIVEANRVATYAMVPPRFIVVAGVWSECVEDAIEFMQVLASNVLRDNLKSGFHAFVA